MELMVEFKKTGNPLEWEDRLDNILEPINRGPIP